MTQPVQLRPRKRLTASQELIWASQRLNPDVPLANMANVTRVEGVIDPERFIAAVDRVVQASDVLRMIVREVDGIPHPNVASSPPQTTAHIIMPLDELDRWMADRIETPLDVGRCVYDSVLIEHEPEIWSWWMDIHHIATDAASSAQVFRAVADTTSASGTSQCLTADLPNSSKLPNKHRAGKRRRPIGLTATTRSNQRSCIGPTRAKTREPSECTSR